MKARIKTLVIEVAGWVLLVAGIAALVLPGPGLLMVFSAMLLLAQRYSWAERLLRPVELRAMYGAAKSVQTWPRIVTATVFALGIGTTGALWLVQPPAPPWWPLDPGWWLIGGRGVGGTLGFSCLVALGLLAWSFRRFRHHPDAVAELRAALHVHRSEQPDNGTE
ncbi:MAG: PGPGW domain-containing protein [Propioniciclava sp.]